MFRIGEFSRLTQVSIRMLRYYDETGILKPAEVDQWTGHRIYSVEQIPRLNRILYLRDSGFNISEIALALNMDDQSLLALLDQKRLEIERAIKAEQEKLRKIELAQSELRGGKGDYHNHISMKSIPAYQVLSLRKVVPTYYSEGDLWKELSEYASTGKIEMTGDAFSIYHDTEFREHNVDIELCIPVKKAGQNTSLFCFRMTEPVPTMACTMVYGDLSNIKGAYPPSPAKGRCGRLKRMVRQQFNLSVLGEAPRKKRQKSCVAISKARKTYKEFSLGYCLQAG